MGVREDIKIIRKALKKLCPTLSVRMARGTAYGWIDVWGSGEFREFTEEEKRALEKFGLNHGANCAVISPESRNFWVKKAKQILDDAPTFKCSRCGYRTTTSKEEYHRVSKEICRGNYVPLKTDSGEELIYVRGEDGFKCPKCGGTMFLISF